MFQVDQFVRYDPEPTSVVAENFPGKTERHTRRNEANAVEPVDIAGKR